MDSTRRRTATRARASSEWYDAEHARTRRETGAQGQPIFEWPATFVLARAYLDQLERWHGSSAPEIASARHALADAESASGAARRDALTALAATLRDQAASAMDSAKVEKLVDAVERLAR